MAGNSYTGGESSNVLIGAFTRRLNSKGNVVEVVLLRRAEAAVTVLPKPVVIGH